MGGGEGGRKKMGKNGVLRDGKKWGFERWGKGILDKAWVYQK